MQNFRYFNLRAYIYYKLLNSLFLGLSVGVVFFIYRPLEPSIYSIGGVFLALALLGVAKIYNRLITINNFFYISLGVEVVMMIIMIAFMLNPYTYTSAIVVYIGYQTTFMFGSYLVRAETYYMSKRAIFSYIDINKQKGYLIGMMISYGIYKYLDYLSLDKTAQIYNIHYILILLQVMIITALLKGFKKL
jgi:hypothetical protein